MNIPRMDTTSICRQRGRTLWGCGIMVSVPVVAALVLLLVASGVVHAAVFQCPSGDVTCLITAINTANGHGEDDTIQLEAGTYTVTAADNATDGPNGLPSITSVLSIQGVGAQSTIIERDASAPPFRIFHIATEADLTLEGLTITGGLATHGGGLANGGTVTLANSTIADNFADCTGGGLGNSGTATLTNSIIADNFAGCTGGGLDNTGTVTLTNSTVAGNRGGSASFGGGLFNDGTVTLTNSTIVDNGGVDAGGGVFNGGTVILTNSTVAGNDAGAPAGAGGGLLNLGGTMILTNSTVADNRSVAAGAGGLENHAGSGVTGTVTLRNTILARNIPGEAPDCVGPVTSLGYNVIGDLTGCTITLQPSDLTGNPGLGSFVDNGTPGHAHIPLLAASQAMNAGDDTVCPETDQLGQPRVGICDIGAIEFQHEALTVTIDIKPGTFPNSINPKSKGVIPVAILTTATFDATLVDPLSGRFGPHGATEVHGQGHIEDVNQDGEPDLLLHFRTQEAGIQCGDTSASLTVKTVDGEPIQGSDMIMTVGCNNERTDLLVDRLHSPVQSRQ
jgi:hypothetical protein